MTRPKAHIVTSPRDWELLVSPARAEIVEAIRLLGPCSIAEVAEALDRPADSLYRHVRVLTEAGFVVDAGVRKGERNLERLVDVVADDFVVEFRDNSGRAENEAIVKTANSFLGAMGRAVRDSAAARQLVFTPEERNISINYELSWLTHEDYQEVRALIRRLKAIMDEGKTRREGRLYMTLAIACPVTRRRGAGGRGSAGEAAGKAGAKAGKKAAKKKARKTGAKPGARRAGAKRAGARRGHVDG